MRRRDLATLAAVTMLPIAAPALAQGDSPQALRNHLIAGFKKWHELKVTRPKDFPKVDDFMEGIISSFKLSNPYYELVDYILHPEADRLTVALKYVQDGPFYVHYFEYPKETA